ncbi:MAG: DUF1289 domain-containing protein [Rheinheimera sp.]|nr:MAG: DUF1289 domain-containing protein [Rheinheimera sp.]
MIDNPCVRNCCLDQSDICLGCGRHVDEITGWHRATDAEKQQILRNAAARLQQREAQNSHASRDKPS